jgi:hypothetical protein
MDPAALVLVVAAGAAAIGFGIYARNKRREAWAIAASELGLHMETGSFMTHDNMSGQIDGFQVIVYIFTRSTGKSSQTYTGFKVSGRGLPNLLTLKREGAGAAIGKLFKGEDIQIGDPFFDRTALVRGDHFTAHAVLDEAARKRAAGFLSEHGKLEDGTLYYETLGGMKDVPALVQRVRGMVELAGALATPDAEKVPRLARKAVGDPLPGVRARSLETLLGGGRLDPLRLETARRCVADPSAEVAVIAALALGEEGVPTLEERIDAPGLPGLLRLEALKALGSQSEGRLLALLGDSDLEVQVAAVRALYEVGTLGAVEHLLPLTQGLLTDGDLKREARNAVDAIQARHGGERGAFTLADASADDVGAVSVAQTPGALSIAKEPRG